MDTIFMRILSFFIQALVWIGIFALGKWLISIKGKKNVLITNKLRGYKSINYDHYKGVTLVGFIVTFIPSIYFTISGLLGVKDVEGDNVILIAMVFLPVVILFLTIFIYSCRCKIYYNDDEIIKYRFIGRKQVIKISDLKKVMITPVSGVVLYSDDVKIKINYDAPNVGKLVDLLKEKGFEINYKL